MLYALSQSNFHLISTWEILTLLCCTVCTLYSLLRKQVSYIPKVTTSPHESIAMSIQSYTSCEGVLLPQHCHKLHQRFEYSSSLSPIHGWNVKTQSAHRASLERSVYVQEALCIYIHHTRFFSSQHQNLRSRAACKAQDTRNALEEGVTTNQIKHFGVGKTNKQGRTCRDRCAARFSTPDRVLHNRHSAALG